MHPHARIAGLVVALAAIAGFLGLARRGTGTPIVRTAPGGALYRLSAGEARRDGALELTAAQRQATFTFDPSVAPSDRQVLLQAVASARPEARRLVGLVDGLVDVTVGRPADPGAVATTLVGGPRYPITIDLGLAWSRAGQRGVDRVFLHELGHVVDHALLPDAIVAPLVAQVPTGWGCEGGRSGACTASEERFAESFAKWATNDIGVNLNLGYAVPPPDTSLQAWGEPLARFGR